MLIVCEDIFDVPCLLKALFFYFAYRRFTYIQRMKKKKKKKKYRKKKEESSKRFLTHTQTHNCIPTTSKKLQGVSFLFYNLPLSVYRHPHIHKYVEGWFKSLYTSNNVYVYTHIYIKKKNVSFISPILLRDESIWYGGATPSEAFCLFGHAQQLILYTDSSPLLRNPSFAHHCRRGFSHLLFFVFFVLLILFLFISLNFCIYVCNVCMYMDSCVIYRRRFIIHIHVMIHDPCRNNLMQTIYYTFFLTSSSSSLLIEAIPSS